MENKEKDLGILKANLKRLIKLRGNTLRDSSTQMEVSYTFLSKFISNAIYKTEKGTLCQYDPPHIKRAIADFLDIPYYDLWYKEGNKIVVSMIEIEIAKTVRKLVEENLLVRSYKNKK